MALQDTSSSNEQIHVEPSRRASDACGMSSYRTLTFAAAAAGLVGSGVPGAALAQGRTCKTGELFAGSPMHRPSAEDKIPATRGLTDEPPLRWRTLTFAGKTL